MSHEQRIPDRIGIPLKAYVRFSARIDQQLRRLEKRIRAKVPQLAKRRESRVTRLGRYPLDLWDRDT